MSDETYEGWKNRETWAFNLHISNDEGMYNETLEQARNFLSDNEEASDFELGEYVIHYWRDFLVGYGDTFGEPMPQGLRMFEQEVGSWWRVDETETGASVRESLS